MLDRWCKYCKQITFMFSPDNPFPSHPASVARNVCDSSLGAGKLSVRWSPDSFIKTNLPGLALITISQEEQSGFNSDKFHVVMKQWQWEGWDWCGYSLKVRLLCVGYRLLSRQASGGGCCTTVMTEASAAPGRACCQHWQTGVRLGLNTDIILWEIMTVAQCLQMNFRGIDGTAKVASLIPNIYSFLIYSFITLRSIWKKLRIEKVLWYWILSVTVAPQLEVVSAAAHSCNREFGKDWILFLAVICGIFDPRLHKAMIIQWNGLLGLFLLVKHCMIEWRYNTIICIKIWRHRHYFP